MNLKSKQSSPGSCPVAPGSSSEAFCSSHPTAGSSPDTFGVVLKLYSSSPDASGSSFEGFSSSHSEGFSSRPAVCSSSSYFSNLAFLKLLAAVLMLPVLQVELLKIKRNLDL